MKGTAVGLPRCHFDLWWGLWKPWRGLQSCCLWFE